MPVSVFWDKQEPAVLRLAFTGMWTWDELSDAAPKVSGLCATQAGRVDLISDMFDSPFRPPHFEEGSNQVLSNNVQPANLRLVVLLVNAFQYSLFSAYANNNPLGFSYTFASGVDAAREVIRASRSGHPLPEYIPPVTINF